MIKNSKEFSFTRYRGHHLPSQEMVARQMLHNITHNHVCAVYTEQWPAAQLVPLVDNAGTIKMKEIAANKPVTSDGDISDSAATNLHR